MTSEREPVLYQIRPDLQYSTQTQQGQSFLVVKDPATNRFFRLPESQAAILDLLREPIDLPTLARQASQRLGADIPETTLARFIDSLRSRQLLETPDGQERLSKGAGERNWLYLRLMSFDAENLFDRLAPKVDWCFTPAFHAFALFSIATGIVITTIHAGQLVTRALALLNPYGIALIWLSVVVVGVMHELAHGLTCRHFGGKVKELGFMLIYFQPAFYCDVSDSWMFPSRRERMWVTFAGGYFQLVVWGVAAMVWRIFADDSVINWIAMSVLVFSGLQTLVNFNPLIKLDGYYMLSDYLEIPNLRQKALQAVRSRIAGRADPLLDSGQRRALLTFGTLALAFSTLLLAVVYVNIYILATSYFAFAGFAAFVLFTGFTIRRTGAETAAGAGALVRRASLKKYRNLAILAVVVALTFIVPWTLRIPAEFSIRAGAEQQVRAPISGMIEEIPVREHQKVHRGQEVAYLYDSELHDRQKELEALYRSKDAEYQELQAGPRREEIELAEQKVRSREQELANVSRRTQDRTALERELESLGARLRQAQDDLKNIEELREEGLVSDSETIKAREEVNIVMGQYGAKEAEIAALDQGIAADRDLKQSLLEEARDELALAHAGASEEERRRVLEERNGYFTRLMKVSEDLQLESVKSEITGIVVTPDLELREGDTVAAGDLLMTIQSVNTVTAELLVAEKDIADVQIGSPIVLVANPYPSRRFYGEVQRIAETAQTVDDSAFFRVTAELQNEDGALLPDMTGHAKIEAGKHPIAFLMTRRLVRWIKTEFWHLLP